MRPPNRNRKPPARGASAAKAPRTSKRQKSKSAGPVVPGPSSSGQFQAEGDLAIPGPSRFLQPQPGPSSSGQIQTSLDSATPGFSRFIPSQPRTSSATLSLSQSGQSHSQENQARAIASSQQAETYKTRQPSRRRHRAATMKELKVPVPVKLLPMDQ
jgi:hypothetical protein